MISVLYPDIGSEAGIAVTDRGLAYGDGLFETIRVRAGIALLAQYHLERLALGCRRLAIDYPAAAAAALLDTACGRLTPAQRVDGVVKLIVTRGDGARGYAAVAGAAPRELAFWTPLPPAVDTRAGIAVRTCRQRLAVQPALAGIKHLNRLEQVLARGEWSDQPWAEGLMLDTDGRVIEGISSNLFYTRRSGEWLTPALDRCGVAGVMRRHIIDDLAAQTDCSVSEVSCQHTDLLAAREVLLCNSVVGIRAVAQIDEHRIGPPGPMTQALQRALQGFDGG